LKCCKIFQQVAVVGQLVKNIDEWAN